MVVEHKNIEFDRLLHRRHNFLRQHEIRTVSDEHINFPARIGHFDPETTGNFVSHAGISILHVIALGVARAPEFVQVTRQTAGRIHDHVTRLQFRIENSDHFALAQRRADTAVVNAAVSGTLSITESF